MLYASCRQSQFNRGLRLQVNTDHSAINFGPQSSQKSMRITIIFCCTSWNSYTAMRRLHAVSMENTSPLRPHHSNSSQRPQTCHLQHRRPCVEMFLYGISHAAIRWKIFDVFHGYGLYQLDVPRDCAKSKSSDINRRDCRVSPFKLPPRVTLLRDISLAHG